ncbi:unnamed protein product [Polarella glacialis]|uniref:SMP-30/Gluconolactonase/LRE-like region domain-containing protein n=1 Tax=Polarella glacialis TaxID=89957 RepID=A0A813ITY1_POLGL|nr:unnamed protein product [Polarella glacialis]
MSAEVVGPTLAAQLVVDAKAHLGEAPFWDSRRGELLWLDILGAQVFQYNPSKGTNAVQDLSSHTAHVTTIVPVEGTDSAVVLGTSEGFLLLDLEDASVQAHAANGSLHGKHTRMNDGKCDPQGRLWIGSIAREGPDGADIVPGGAALYVLDGWASMPTKVLEGVSVSNGITWSKDGQTMYYTDSPTFGIDAFAFDGAAATHSQLATQRRRCIDVCAGFPPVPDGCALDADGKLWVACFGAGQVRRYDPTTGTLLATVLLPAEAGLETTACAFGGPDLDELYVTTAHEFWSEEKLAQMPLAGGLFRVPREELAKLGSPIRGLPMHTFKR